MKYIRGCSAPLHQLRAHVALLIVVLVFAPCLHGSEAPGTAASTIAVHPSAQLPQGSARPEKLDDIHLSPNQWTGIGITLGEADRAGDFTRELVRAQWRQGDPIDLYVVRPTGKQRPPVVLFLYGFPSTVERFRDDSFCRKLIRGGFAVIGFDAALTGQRYNNRPMKEWFVSELQESLGKSTHDVQMVLNYLASRNDLDMSRVGIFGQGSGGTIAILAAAADSRIRAVDALDPWGDWQTWFAKSPVVPERERASYLKPSFLGKVAPLDPISWLPSLKSRSLRLQLAAFDESLPEITRDKLRKALPADAILVTYATESDYRDRAANDGKILQWLHAQLVGKE